ncbi:MAG: Holliday junction branch migration protein RuvA [Firmicutes bacterium]|nr:Holliday junction branch migration protein RuvA [Bacillota bacterium]
MISLLNGTIANISENSLIIDVNGVGYEVFCTGSCLTSYSVGDNAKIFTHTRVTQDDISLFGFSSIQEKNMFLRLISISGIGAKVAVNVLSSMSVADLSKFVTFGDTTNISRIKGIGKKTAERIVLELKDKISDEFKTVLPERLTQQNIDTDDEAVIALISLGYSKSDAIRSIAKHFVEGATTEELIMKVLKG